MAEARFLQLEADLMLAPRRGFRDRLRLELESKAMKATQATTEVKQKGKPVGFRTVSAYITVADPDGLMKFATAAFGAVELDRAIGGEGGLNLIADISGSKVFFAGGPMCTGEKRKLNDLRLWVPNCDEVFARAIQAGATSVMEPGDRPYGERNGGVKDPAGNTWWIATRFESSPLPEGFGALSCYLMKPRALALIGFLKQAFGVEEVELFKTPEGQLMHGAVRWGDSILELGEADTQRGAFYVFVEDPDAVFASAVAAGAKVIYPPADHAYGHRSGGVEDAWGNTWYLARDLTV
jgi:PhnB protein